mmetsp:Transcript_159583/g.306377  ORF Transcript_159583/g.306377 Transcript_159583/m.306377 type:complete len:818 (-) Transcript_159583:60-2513(-)
MPALIGVESCGAVFIGVISSASVVICSAANVLDVVNRVNRRFCSKPEDESDAEHGDHEIRNVAHKIKCIKNGHDLGVGTVKFDGEILEMPFLPRNMNSVAVGNMIVTVSGRTVELRPRQPFIQQFIMEFPETAEAKAWTRQLAAAAQEISSDEHTRLSELRNIVKAQEITIKSLSTRYKQLCKQMKRRENKRLEDQKKTRDLPTEFPKQEQKKEDDIRMSRTSDTSDRSMQDRTYSASTPSLLAPSPQSHANGIDSRFTQIESHLQSAVGSLKKDNAELQSKADEITSGKKELMRKAMQAMVSTELDSTPIQPMFPTRPPIIASDEKSLSSVSSSQQFTSSVAVRGQNYLKGFAPVSEPARTSGTSGYSTKATFSPRQRLEMLDFTAVPKSTEKYATSSAGDSKGGWTPRSTLDSVKQSSTPVPEKRQSIVMGQAGSSVARSGSTPDSVVSPGSEKSSLTQRLEMLRVASDAVNLQVAEMEKRTGGSVSLSSDKGLSSQTTVVSSLAESSMQDRNRSPTLTERMEMLGVRANEFRSAAQRLDGESTQPNSQSPSLSGSPARRGSTTPLGGSLRSSLGGSYHPAGSLPSAQQRDESEKRSIAGSSLFERGSSPDSSVSPVRDKSQSLLRGSTPTWDDLRNDLDRVDKLNDDRDLGAVAMRVDEIEKKKSDSRMSPNSSVRSISSVLSESKKSTGFSSNFLQQLEAMNTQTSSGTGSTLNRLTEPEKQTEPSSKMSDIIGWKTTSSSQRLSSPASAVSEKSQSQLTVFSSASTIQPRLETETEKVAGEILSLGGRPPPTVDPKMADLKSWMVSRRNPTF